MTSRPPKAPHKKRIANVSNPTLEAVINGLFRFEKGQQALAMMGRIRSQFVLSKDQQDEHSITLWIKGFPCTPEEEKEGYLGHFALISCHFADGKFTLQAEKLDTPLKMHPQRQRPPQKQPDWGHPVLRYVLKGKIYQSVDSARNTLLRMHEEFPETTIPGVDKLHCIVYNRQLTTTPPVEKITLRVQENPDGTATIIKAENKPKKEVPKPATPTESKGYYTTLIKKRRDKKK